MRRALLLGAATVAACAVAGDNNGPQIGRALDAYLLRAGVTATPTMAEHLRYNRGNRDFSETELDEVLALFEERIGRPTLVTNVQQTPKAFLVTRVVRLRAFLTVVDVVLGKNQSNEVLRASVAAACKGDFQKFLRSSALARRFEWEDARRFPSQREELLKTVEAAIATHGYPLPDAHARLVVAKFVPNLDALQERHGGDDLETPLSALATRLVGEWPGAEPRRGDFQLLRAIEDRGLELTQMPGASLQALLRIYRAPWLTPTSRGLLWRKMQPFLPMLLDQLLQDPGAAAAVLNSGSPLGSCVAALVSSKS